MTAPTDHTDRSPALFALGSPVVFAAVSSGRLNAPNVVMLVVVFAAAVLLVVRISLPALRGALRTRRHEDDDDEMIDIAERLSQVLPGGAEYGAGMRSPSEPPPSEPPPFVGVLPPTG